MDNLSHSGISIAHLNAGSLLAVNRLDLLKLQIQTSEVDVFGISESWLTVAIPTGLIRITGYKVSRLDRSWCDAAHPGCYKRGGGFSLLY